MPNNISPELLKLLQAGGYTAAPGHESTAGGSFLAPEPDGGMHSFLNPTYYDQASNYFYEPVNSYSGLDSSGQLISTPIGYHGYDASSPDAIGKMNNIYDTKGNYTGQFASPDPKDGDWFDKLVISAIGAMAGGAAYGAMGGAGAGAGSGGGSGAFLGEAPWTATGGGALDFGAAGGAAGAAGGGALGAGGAAGGGGSLVGSSGGMQGLAGSNAAFNSAVGGGSGLGSLFGSAGGIGSLLGPATTLLGGALGGEGRHVEESAQQKKDPRVDPYLFGQNGQPGLLGMAYDQLARSQSPEQLAQRDQIRSTGMNLLQQPVAGNGFGRFFPGR